MHMKKGKIDEKGFSQFLAVLELGPHAVCIGTALNLCPHEIVYPSNYKDI